MTPLVRRDCFDVVGGFCEDRRMLCFEDWEMWTRLSTRFRWSLASEILAQYRLHDGNTYHASTLDMDELRMDLIDAYHLNAEWRREANLNISARCWHWATQLYETQPRVALRLLMRQAKSNPVCTRDRHYWGLIARCVGNAIRR